MTETVACIPTIGLSPYLDDLVMTLMTTGMRTRLYFNGETVKENILQIIEGWPHDGMIELVHMPNDSIYIEWNDAARWAADRSAHLLLVTDDVVLSGDVVTELIAALDCRPEYGLISTDASLPLGQFSPTDVHAVSHQIGNRYNFATWCFIARPSAWQDVDPRYQIWYGDDDLIWKVNQAHQGVGYLQGVGVTHHTSTTCQQLPWVMQAAHEDGILWMNTGH